MIVLKNTGKFLQTIKACTKSKSSLIFKHLVGTIFMKIKGKVMFKKILLLSALLFSVNASAANYLDTQYGQDGVEVHLLKAKVSNNVLTISFMVENTTGAKVKFQSMVAASVNYTSADKKYPILKDANGKWLASTITYDESNSKNSLFTSKDSPYTYHYTQLEDKNKRVGWIKFEAPQDSDWPIEVTLPGVSPFTIEKPQ